MASAHPASASVQPAPVPQPAAPPPSTATASQAASPPSRQNLRTWWKNFSNKGPGKNQDTQGISPQLSYITQFKEGSMSKDVPVAENVPDSLLGEPPNAPQAGSSNQQMPPKARQPRMARPPPSGRQRMAGSNNRNYQPARRHGSFGRRIETFVTVLKYLRVEHKHRKSLMKSIAKQSSAAEPTGIFGVPLRQSITYANVAISLVDADGKSYIYGYVPIVVAKCGVFLKEKATNVEGIFRLSGAEKRIKELVVIFNSPDRYGKGLDWDGYTVHDAANVLRRYLNQLPEPIVPLDLYDRFRDPLRGHALEAIGDQEASQVPEDFDLDGTILKYQQLITELPPLNRQLLLYILDLLAVFASKSDENRMTSQNLAAIFQPGMLSHPAHDMAPAEYRLSQDVLVFLIENQDHFLIGMRGTAADEKTVQDVQNGGTPPLPTPSTPTQGMGNNTVGRSASNASAGADSLRRQGGVRRNVSVNSRHSRQSNGAPSPASPAFGGPLTQTTSGGVHRSNTVPSKKSPGIASSRLQKPLEGRSPTNPATPVFQQTSADASEIPPEPISKDLPAMSSSWMASTPTAATNSTEYDASPKSSPWMQPSAVGTSSLAATSNTAVGGQSKDKLLPDPPESKPESSTPGRDRTFFHRSPTAESEKKQPNKLRKKRNVSSNPSAQSSSNSLTGPSGNASPAIPTTHPTQEIAEHPHFASIPSDDPTISHTEASPVIEQEPNTAKLAPLPARPEEAHRSSDGTLKPQNSFQSLGSRDESMNEQSDLDNIDDPGAGEQKDKRKRWRLSRRKDETLGANLTSPKKGIGANGGADTSTTSFNSGRGRKSFTADTIPTGSDSGMASTHQQTSNDSGPSHESVERDKEEKKGNLLDRIKRKMQEAKEEKRERDAEKEKEKVGKGERRISTGEARGKSMDMRRSAEKETEAPAAPVA